MLAVVLGWAALRPHARASTVLHDARPQFVLVGFDVTPGPRERIEDQPLVQFHRAINRRGSDNSFTIFINTGYLQLSPRRSWKSEDALWKGRLPFNAPVIKYARDRDAIEHRIAGIRELQRRGVEIGSHAVRHLRGADWTDEEWNEEFQDHARILQLAGLPQPRGFRAPFLHTSRGLGKALKKHGFAYDASGVSGARWPRKLWGTDVWQLASPKVPIEGVRGSRLFFDLQVRSVLTTLMDSQRVPESERAMRMEDLYYRSALAEFERRYRNTRAPLLLSGHGNFMPAIARFMRTVCGREHVRCTTMSDAAAYLSANEGALLGAVASRRR